MKANKALISIIVPIYNIYENLLRRCIQSLTGQTETRIEIILIDDGSPDKSGQICDEYAKSDSRIRVIHNINGGVSVARNSGINVSTGKYIMFVDPDDFLVKNCLEKILPVAEMYNPDILLFRKYSQREKNTEGSNEVNLLSDTATLQIKTLTKEDGEFNIGMCWAKLFKSSFIGKNNLRYVPGVQKAQDRLFVFDCYGLSPKVYSYDFVGYYYTEDYENSICRKYNPQISTILLNTAKKFSERVSDNRRIEYTKAFDLMCIQDLLEMHQLYFGQYNNDHKFKELRRELRFIAGEEPFKTALRRIEIKTLQRRCKRIVICLRYHLYSLCIIQYRLLNVLKNLDFELHKE